METLLSNWTSSEGNVRTSAAGEAPLDVRVPTLGNYFCHFMYDWVGLLKDGVIPIKLPFGESNLKGPR